MSDYEYRNIKVKPETFDELRENKPDGVSWDFNMLRNLCSSYVT